MPAKTTESNESHERQQTHERTLRYWSRQTTGSRLACKQRRSRRGPPLCRGIAGEQLQQCFANRGPVPASSCLKNTKASRHFCTLSRAAHGRARRDRSRAGGAAGSPTPRWRRTALPDRRRRPRRTGPTPGSRSSAKPRRRTTTRGGTRTPREAVGGQGRQELAQPWHVLAKARRQLEQHRAQLVLQCAGHGAAERRPFRPRVDAVGELLRRLLGAGHYRLRVAGPEPVDVLDRLLERVDHPDRDLEIEELRSPVLGRGLAHLDLARRRPRPLVAHQLDAGSRGRRGRRAGSRRPPRSRPEASRPRCRPRAAGPSR